MAQLNQLHQPRRDTGKRDRPIEHGAGFPFQPLIRGLEEPLFHPQPFARPQHHRRRDLTCAHLRQHREPLLQPHRTPARDPRREKIIQPDSPRRWADEVEPQRHHDPSFDRHADRRPTDFMVPRAFGVMQHLRLLLLCRSQFQIDLTQRDLQSIPLPRRPREILLERRDLGRNRLS